MSEIQKKSMSENIKNLRLSVKESEMITGGGTSKCNVFCTVCTTCVDCITGGSESCVACISCISKTFDKDGEAY